MKAVGESNTKVVECHYYRGEEVCYERPRRLNTGCSVATDVRYDPPLYPDDLPDCGCRTATTRDVNLWRAFLRLVLGM